MLRFIIQRALFSIPVIIGIVLVTFLMLRSIPGDPCRAILGERATDEICDAFSTRYGLDKSIPEQMIIYMGRALQGDLDVSFRFGRPVTDLIVERLPTTLELGITALTFAVIVGIPLGIVAAYRHNSWVDVVTMLGANVGVSMPVFWLGLMLSYIFGVLLKDSVLALPPSGRLDAGSYYTPFYVVWGLAGSEDTASGLLIFLSRINTFNALLTLNAQQFFDAARHLILPAVAVGTIPLAIIARMMRSSLLEALNQDYVRTARSKGLSEFRVVLIHAVRNSLLPVVTVVGLQFGSLMAGAVLTESVFGLSGVGRMLTDGITSRDYTVVQGFTIFIAVSFVFVNWFVDILYAYLDPRVRLS